MAGMGAYADFATQKKAALLFRARFPRPAKAAPFLLALGLFDAGQALTQRGQLCGLAGKLAGLLTQPGGLVNELAGLAIYQAHLLVKHNEGLACCGALDALLGLVLFWAAAGRRRLFRLFFRLKDAKLAVDLLPSHAPL
jgi:hypothetical protein